MERAAPNTAAEPDVRPWPQTIGDFEALVGALQHRLVQFAFCRLHSLADAEDVVQDVLVQAYRDREKHRRVDNACPFLYRMVANRCTDVLRRRRREAGPPQEAVEPSSGKSSGLLRPVENLLGTLPARQAEVVRLRVFAGLPFGAVAQAAGCSVPTVKSRFRYAIQKLRKVLER